MFFNETDGPDEGFFQDFECVLQHVVVTGVETLHDKFQKFFELGLHISFIFLHEFLCEDLALYSEQNKFESEIRQLRSDFEHIVLLHIADFFENRLVLGGDVENGVGLVLFEGDSLHFGGFGAFFSVEFLSRVQEVVLDLRVFYDLDGVSDEREGDEEQRVKGNGGVFVEPFEGVSEHFFEFVRVFRLSEVVDEFLLHEAQEVQNRVFKVQHLRDQENAFVGLVVLHFWHSFPDIKILFLL